MGWKLTKSYDERWDDAEARQADREAEIRRPAKKEDWWWQDGEWGRWCALEREAEKAVQNTDQKRSNAVAVSLEKAIIEAAVVVPSTQQPASKSAVFAVASNMAKDTEAFLLGQKVVVWKKAGKPVDAAKTILLGQGQEMQDACKVAYDTAIANKQEDVEFEARGTVYSMSTDSCSEWLDDIQQNIRDIQAYTPNKSNDASEESAPLYYWSTDEASTWGGSTFATKVSFGTSFWRSQPGTVPADLKLLAKQIYKERFEVLNTSRDISTQDVNDAIEACEKDVSVKPKSYQE